MRTGIALITTAASLVLSCSLLSHRTIVFEGTSMLPTIKNGDRLQTMMLNAESRAGLVRGDIVAFRYPKDPSKGYIMRLIGLPGDTVEIQKGEVWVNGSRLFEPYVDPKLNMSQRSLPPVSVPQQAYYLLGDNRDNSNDSRTWGSVPAELVYAKTVSN